MKHFKPNHTRLAISLVSILSILAALLLLTGAIIHAQSGGNYDLAWWTVDSGGGSLSGNGYALSGTAGQPDAGIMEDDGYKLSGGFWGGVAHTGYTAPTAAFSASPLTGTPPLDVQFTDQSTGDIVAWTWDFGDGGVSGARHPLHQYTYPGAYTVTLTVTGPGGSDTETKVGYITALPDGIPTCEIDDVFPNPVTQHPTQTLYFNGNCFDNDADEGGAYMVTHRWRSDIDGLLNTAEDFSIPASEISAGVHVISLQGQDDEGEWSPEVTRTLTVESLPLENVRTLILVNHQKLESLYSVSEAAQVMDKLDELAAHDRVGGLVVPVEEDAAVAAAYAAWDADPTSTVGANAVAEAIKALVDAQWSVYPDLEYLVIVGDDHVVPFHRVLDQTRYPEHHYRRVSITSTVGAALHGDMTLTDDYYADAVPTIPDTPRWDGHDLYIPDLGVGRLIETPDEIVAQIDIFLAGDEIAADEALVSGYGFVRDGAWAMCGALNDDGLVTDCDLIGGSWDADDFGRVLNTRHDVVSINGHANHYVISTPLSRPWNGEWVYSSDIVNATADHARAIFYTLGCHSGLNVPPTNPYEPLDTAQALIQQQANYVANTGYGWGYIFSVGLSEQLMLDFTERLVYGQSATLGQALAGAKQEYYLDEGHFGYYDEKILIESTLYGLPMYRYNTPATATRRQPGAQATVVKEEMSVLGDGLTVNSLSYQFPALLAESTDDGLYYTLGGLAHASDGEPIQPKYTADLSFPGTKAHGAVFKGGVYTDVASFDPVVEQAITETATLAEPDFDAPGWYPSQVHHLNRLERGDRLVTLLGQFNASSETERVYDELSFDVYYHTASDDWTAPSVASVNSGLEGNTATVTVDASDPSGIEAIIVTHTAGGGAWDSVDLTQSGSLWTAGFSADGDTEFFVQVVDKAGNVAVQDNDGKYFKLGESLFTIYLPLVMRSH
jgi:PKD repeat protein